MQQLKNADFILCRLEYAFLVSDKQLFKLFRNYILCLTTFILLIVIISFNGIFVNILLF